MQRTMLAAAAAALLATSAHAEMDLQSQFDRCESDDCRFATLRQWEADMWDEFGRWRKLWADHGFKPASRLISIAVTDNAHYYRHRAEFIKPSEAEWLVNKTAESAFACRSGSIIIKHALVAIDNNFATGETTTEVREAIVDCNEKHAISE